MESQKINKDVKSKNAIGILPMELAEPSSENNDRWSEVVCRCSSALVKKIFIALGILLIAIITTMILLTILNYNVSEDASSKEIIVVTGARESTNLTIDDNGVELFLQLKNNTSEPALQRKKRSASAPTELLNPDVMEGFNDDEMKKAREIIIAYDAPCKADERNEFCKGLVEKVNSVKAKKDIEVKVENKSDTSVTRIVKDYNVSATTEAPKNDKDFDKKVLSHDLVKKAPHDTMYKPEGGILLDQNPRFQNPYNLHPPVNYVPQAPPNHNQDTCLLAKLLKQHYPTVQEYLTKKPVYEAFSAPPYLFDVPNMDYLEYDPTSFVYEQPEYFIPRYKSSAPPVSFLSQSQVREDMELQESKPHNQDVGIALSYKTSEDPSKNLFSTRTNNCPVGMVSCENFESCISENQWCDGKVDCSDVSDEIHCDCKRRVDQSRLCDGYYDCPFGEDEMGCFGCDATIFSCDDPDLNAHSTCFTKQQRCDNVFNCPNGKDEMECNILSPTLHEKPLFPVSNTEGFLQRNYRGNWYSVCINPYMWAHDACRRETGLIIRPPFIHMAPIDPALKITYINNGFEGLVHKSESCENSTAVYVTCPALLCGTRVLTTPQLLRQNSLSESRLYGRTKRFHQHNNPYVPILRYNRAPTSFSDAINTIKSGGDRNINQESRSKRTESRVVGGNPSQPAAWPWVVAVYKDGAFHCGGVILNHRWVLSAAHCVDKFWEHYYEIKAGMLRRFSFSPQEQNLKVTHVITNKFYDRSDMTNDLALMRVKPEILFSRWIRPICLPRRDTIGRGWKWGPPPGTVCTAVGWGATVEHGRDPDHLREVELPIWEKCNHREDLLGNEICAGYAEGGKDSCQGDSGGPLLCRNPLNSQQWYVAGIVSHGLGCGRKGEPGVYTRVSLQIEWINYHLSLRNLPTLQPKQECPGFKCVSGIPKCLNISMVCDKFVDCLNAEDELNCNPMHNNSPLESVLPSKFINNINSSENLNSSFEFERASDSIDNTKPNKDSSTITASNTNSVLDELIVDDLQEISASKHKSTKKYFAAHEVIESKIQVDSDKNNLTSKLYEQIDSTTTASNVKKIESATNYNEFRSRNTKKNLTETNSHVTEQANGFTSHVIFTPEERTENHNFTAVFRTGTTNILPTNFANNSAVVTSENVSTNKYVVTESFDNSPTTPMSVTQTNDLGNGLKSKEHSQELSLDNVIAKKNSSNNDKEEDTLNNESFPHINVIHETLVERKEPVFDKNESQNVDRKILPSVSHEVVFLPAKQKKKHQIPHVFNCHRIQQTIPYQLRCDHKADCEDGTDEHGCACADYITTFNEKLLCDGIIDCADGTDEINCFECEADHFLCKSSQTCIPMKHVCDESTECPSGEDERDCFALSNGKTMVIDFEGKPKTSLEGFLTKKHENSWDVVCEDDLSNARQEQAANHICRYLGFSGANRFLVKYINIKENKLLKASDIIEKRRKRQTTTVPIQFTYKTNDFEDPRHIVIKEPEVLKEHCVPNVTKICMTLYVYCEPTLFTDFSLLDVSQDVQLDRSDQPDKRNSDNVHLLWPWTAKVYFEGEYRCTGILVDLSWVLVGQACLWDTLITKHYVTVVLGTVRTLNAGHGPHEQSIWVDYKKDLYSIQVTLLHLVHPAIYSNMVKPMVIPSYSEEIKEDACVAIGQDNNNTTLNVFLQTTDVCEMNKRCFLRNSKENICPPGTDSKRSWVGMVACHTAGGWLPKATFVENRGECGLKDRIIATDLGRLKTEIKPYIGKSISTAAESYPATCDGIRCARGRCVSLIKTCNYVHDCEDGSDETESACEMKQKLCSIDPYQRACECASGQLKCKNGRCISKELFGNGRDDCKDGSDEPTTLTCFQYLARSAPLKLCDGFLNCADRSDEEPAFCKCFAKRSYKCGSSDTCIAPDLVCDGIRDCPNGEDEKTCLGLKAPEGAAYGTGELIMRSFGVWHTKCYSTSNHTRTELESICRELGFLSGHAKQLPPFKSLSTYTKVITGTFSDVVLNNNTSIKLRSSDEPFATSVPEENKECYPVYIECL